MNAEIGIEFPSGVFFDSESDLELWRQYTSIRLVSDWRDSDLLMVSKMIRLENDIQSANKIIDQEGLLIDVYGKDGDLVGQKEHPAVKVRDTLLNRLVSIQRHLSINQLPSHPQTVNAHGKKAAQKAKTKQKVSLLASL
jgi:hypothetical protein